MFVNVRTVNKEERTSEGTGDGPPGASAEQTKTPLFGQKLAPASLLLCFARSTALSAARATASSNILCSFMCGLMATPQETSPSVTGGAQVGPQGASAPLLPRQHLSAA